MVRIAFALPVPNSKIIGGYKVVYEYANFLAEKGLDVSLVYNAHNGENSKNLPKFLVYIIRWVIGMFGPRWFTLSPEIHRIVVPHFTEQTFFNYDVAIATATETAEAVSKANGKKIYFVQDFENWGRSEEEVYETYKFDMEIVTISKWLKSIIDEFSVKPAKYIPNGIDKNIFFEKQKYENRGEHTVCTMFHWDKMKGCDIAFKLLYRLKDRYPDFEAYLFGTPKKDDAWPEWIHYIQKATPNEVAQLMNSARVFLCTSRQEGFGLTGLESLFCGCVLVTTDCHGVREYASEKNSYICEIDNEDVIFESICLAFDDEYGSKAKRLNSNMVNLLFDEKKSKESFYEVVVSGV